MTLDQTQDRNLQGLHHLQTAYGLPEFVKQAAQPDIVGDETLEPHMFADALRRHYPCHTPPATYVSAGFFFQKRGELSPAHATRVEDRIRKSAHYFGILPQVEALAEKIAAAQTVDESQLPDSTFAIVMDFEGGHKERRYPLRNALEVKTAAEYLRKYRDEFRFDDRRRIADKILEKASEFGADVAEYRNDLEKMAGLGACAGRDAAELIRHRVTAIGHTHRPNPLQQELLKLADSIETNPQQIYHYDTLCKLAATIDQLDSEHSFKKYYGGSFERPEDVLFGVTQKQAAEQSNELIGTLTGNYYKRADLAGVPVTALSDVLGNDFAREVSTAGAWIDTEKLAAIAPTLPLGDAELFDAAVMEQGIRPFAAKSAAVATRVPTEELDALAAQHTPNPGGLWAHIRRPAVETL